MIEIEKPNITALSTQEDEETDYSKFYLFCKKY